MAYDYYGGWAPYVSVAERRQKAQRAMDKLRKKGHPVAPVVIEGRTIATTFWGKAWCENLEKYHDFANRLARGRTYVRNGSVVDLQIAPLQIDAQVSGSELYQVSVRITGVSQGHWESLCQDCVGGIDSLVELLQGRFSKATMERLCRQKLGLFPTPSEIKFSCSCPDSASMCKHVAAVLYGVGARLDHKPELLFRMRSVDERDLLGRVDASMPLSKNKPAAGKLLDTDDLSDLFGLDMVASAPDVAASVAKVSRSKPSARTTAKAATPSLKRAAKPAPAKTVVAAKAGKTMTKPAKTNRVAEPAPVKGAKGGPAAVPAKRTAPKSATPAKAPRATAATRASKPTRATSNKARR
jgi:uncharacterized Zn finger protein